MIVINIHRILNFNLFGFSSSIPFILQQWIIFDIIAKVMESLGIAILISQYVIIILSMYYPDKVPLQIIEGIVALCDNTLSIIHFLKYGSFEYLFTFFLVKYKHY